MTTVREAIHRAARRLADADIPEPRTEARRLLALATGGNTNGLRALADTPLAAEALARFEALVGRRAEHEPFAYIAGEREFWSLPFRVTPATLIPRPDTETVVEAALAHVRARGNDTPRILDLGTGSGCILLALLSELPRATGIGVDASAAALDVATANARALGLGERAALHRGDWTEGVAGPFDLIVSNPPYIAEADIAILDADVARFEPHAALSGGRDGLDAYRAIAAAVPPLLAPAAALVLEVGFGQAEPVSALLRGTGLDIDGVRADLAGIPRCVVATRPEI
jgi:release factor glutamine methyltransferase